MNPEKEPGEIHRNILILKSHFVLSQYTLFLQPLNPFRVSRRKEWVKYSRIYNKEATGLQSIKYLQPKPHTQMSEQQDYRWSYTVFGNINC